MRRNRLRVHQIAKDMDVTSAKVLAYLKSQGEAVKSPSSAVKPSTARRLRESPPNWADVQTKRSLLHTVAPTITLRPRSPDGNPKERVPNPSELEIQVTDSASLPESSRIATGDPDDTEAKYARNLRSPTPAPE
ncbi:translation initiation factor IF-2 N-terminal domain-containing protein [Gordonia sp. FQ]|uniref:translation initiation factor IF-2 N-terminal domain-containing protein n=1 Tax=Gordonia sp. FQ TaxID=3446634 RepID=UPI003F849BB8